MNREEAIYRLKNTAWLGSDDDREATEEALNMAIEAIKAKTDGDTISREKAVNEIHKYFVEEIDKTPTEIDEDGDELYADMPMVNSLLACNKELSKRIKSLPSAPDSRQRGEWTYLHGSIGSYMTMSCPFCGVTFNNVAEWEYNYCPNCGAKMKGGEEE